MNTGEISLNDECHMGHQLQVLQKLGIGKSKRTKEVMKVLSRQWKQSNMGALLGGLWIMEVFG